ncbi:hypothetical protein, partial [Sporisorium scitamineum]
MSLFRTFGGVAMVLGPLLSIPLTRVHFDVGHDKSRPVHNAFVPLIGFFSAKDGRWKIPCLILGLMLVSAYLSANVLFL